MKIHHLQHRDADKHISNLVASLRDDQEDLEMTLRKVENCVGQCQMLFKTKTKKKKLKIFKLKLFKFKIFNFKTKYNLPECHFLQCLE